MGFAYGIHGIGQFLLPQLAQLDAGIRVSKLGGQLQLLVRFGIGGKLVELFLGKGKRFLQEGNAPFVMGSEMCIRDRRSSCSCGGFASETNWAYQA
mgnify:CR=1 FL=1